MFEAEEPSPDIQPEVPEDLAQPPPGPQPEIPAEPAREPAPRAAEPPPLPADAPPAALAEPELTEPERLLAEERLRLEDAQRQEGEQAAELARIRDGIAEQDRLIREQTLQQEQIHADEAARLQRDYEEALQAPDPRIRELGRQVDYFNRQLEEHKRQLRELLAAARLRSLEDARDAKLAEVRAALAAVKLRAEELRLKEERWPEERWRLADAWEKRLESVRRRRVRTTERYLSRIAAIRAEIEQAKKTAEQLKGTLYGNRPADARLAAVWGDLEAARLEWVFGKHAHHEAREALERQIAAIDAELRDARDRAAAFESSKAVRENEREDDRRWLREGFRKGIKDLKTLFPLSPLRKQARMLETKLRVLLRAQEEAPSEAGELEAVKAGFQAKLRQAEADWAKERTDLEAQILLKQRELKKLRQQAADAKGDDAKAAQDREAAQKAAQAAIAERLNGLALDFRERKAELEKAITALKTQVAQAEAAQGSTADKVAEARKAVEEDVARLHSEIGGLKGLLAANEAEAAKVKLSLESSLSELEDKLTEARFAAGNIGKEGNSLSREHEQQLQTWEQASAKLEQLLAEFLDRSGAAGSMLQQWQTLASRSLGRLSEVYRQEILSRAGELEAWKASLAAVDAKLTASKGALQETVATYCLEAGLRAFNSGDLEEARKRLRRVLTLRPDPEAERVLKLIEEPPKSPSETGLPPGEPAS